MYIQIDRQLERQIGRQIDRQINRQTDIDIDVDIKIYNIFIYNTITNFRPIYFSFCGNLKVIFEIEVSKMCNLKTKIIPVVTGAMGMIKK